MKRTTALQVAVFVFLTALLSWAREDRLTNTGAAPAAQGKVTTSTDRNGNTKIEVSVKHMAPPESLTPSRHSYVVWLAPRGQQPQVMGVLRINGDTLEGSVEGTTTEKVFDVVVTAEENQNPTSPLGTEILKGTVERH
jgi:hypothetical protein